MYTLNSDAYLTMQSYLCITLTVNFLLQDAAWAINSTKILSINTAS